MPGMSDSIRLTPRPSASAPAVALRDVRKVYGRGDGAVVALDGVSAAPAGSQRSSASRRSWPWWLYRYQRG